MARDPLIVGRIPPSLQAEIDQHCQRTGTTKSELIRAALTGHLLLLSTTPTPTRERPAGARTRSDARSTQQCTHRTRTGSYCNRCERII